MIMEEIDLAGLTKSLPLPPGFTAPAELTYEDVRATAISRADLRQDVQGINASIELIRRTRGGSWPSEPVTEEYNFVDLVWHECEFRDNGSFTYALYRLDGPYLGCCYLYPMGRRVPLTRDLLRHDVDVSWWVTPHAYERGYYNTVYLGLQSWVAEAFPFTDPYFSNVEIPGEAPKPAP
jgi:hypothetical protein